MASRAFSLARVGALLGGKSKRILPPEIADDYTVSFRVPLLRGGEGETQTSSALRSPARRVAGCSASAPVGKEGRHVDPNRRYGS